MVKRVRKVRAPAPVMKVLRLPLSALVLSPENVRLHSHRQVDALAAALDRFKQQSPIVIDGKRVVLKGNGTVLAARQLGWDSIDCVTTTLKDQTEIEAYAIADNRLSDLSEFDDERLAPKLLEISAADLLGATGFDDAELADLTAALTESTPGPKRGLNGFKAVPVVRIVVAIENSLNRFEAAMQATGEMNREKALLRICDAYLANHAATQRDIEH